MRLTAVDTNALVEEVRRDLQSESAGRNIEWRVEELPHVHGDPEMLRLVVYNLLSNAVKYTAQRDPAIIEIGSIAALLGASPGASTAAPIMLQVLEKVFAKNVATPEWQAKIRQIVPSYGTKLNDDPARVAQEWAYTSEQLQLPAAPRIDTAALKPVPASSTVLNSSDTPVPAPVHDLAP